MITTPLTFCATVNAILHAGATPVLADVDPVTMNIDPAAVPDLYLPMHTTVLVDGARAARMFPDALSPQIFLERLQNREDLAALFTPEDWATLAALAHE